MLAPDSCVSRTGLGYNGAPLHHVLGQQLTDATRAGTRLCAADAPVPTRGNMRLLTLAPPAVEWEAA